MTESLLRHWLFAFIRRLLPFSASSSQLSVGCFRFSGRTPPFRVTGRWLDGLDGDVLLEDVVDVGVLLARLAVVDADVGVLPTAADRDGDFALQSAALDGEV